MDFMWDKTEAKNALNELIDITAEFGRDIVGVLFDDEPAATRTRSAEDDEEVDDEDKDDEANESAEDEAGGAATGGIWDVILRHVQESTDHPEPSAEEMEKDAHASEKRGE